MKDYTFVLNKEERKDQQKEFILNYTYSRSLIIVNTADGKSSMYMYSKNQIEELNIQMKRQFKTLGEKASNILFLKNLKLSINGLLSTYLISIYGTEGNDISKCIWALLVFIPAIANLIMKKDMIQDIEKHSLLFDDETLVEAFNCITRLRYLQGILKGEFNIKVDTDDLTKGVNRKRIDDLYDYSKDHLYLNLNTVNVLRSKDVKRLLKNGNKVLLNMCDDEKTIK